MKLFASDYDGTFFQTGINDLIENKQAVEQWQEAGNKFTFATGRGITSLVQEFNEVNLPYDYIIGLNGALIVDKDHNILHQEVIRTEVVIEIVSFIVKENFLSFMISDGFNGTLTIDEQKAPSLKEMKDNFDKRGLFNLSLTESLSRSVSQISIIGLTTEESRHLSQKISDFFHTEVVVYQNRNSIDISPRFVNKGYGLNKLSNLLNNPFQEIYCIGDNFNDIDMVNRFNGYSISNSPSELQSVSSNQFKSVKDAILYALNK